MANPNFNCMICWEEFLPPEEKASLPATNSNHTFWTNDKSKKYTLLAEHFALSLTFRYRQHLRPLGKLTFSASYWYTNGHCTNSAPLLADLFLYTFGYDFMLKTMKEDISKAVQFSNTFRYIHD